MRFYRIQATITAGAEIPRRRSDDFDDFAEHMRNCSQRLFIKSDKKDIVYGINTDKNNWMRLGAIINENSDINEVLERYMKLCGFKAEYDLIEEETFDSLRANLRMADGCDFIDDDDDLLSSFGISPLTDHFRDIYFDDNIIELKDKEQITREAQNHLYSDSFLPEIDRIYAGKKKCSAIGHPMHYYIRTRLDETRRELCRSLISALYENGRILNKRYVFVDFFANNPNFRESELDALYKSCEGGAIIIRYRSKGDPGNDGPFAKTGMNVIEGICKVARRYQNSVQTIFWTHIDCVKIRDNFLFNLNSMPIVEISEDKAADERARNYLKEKAREQKIRVDNKLFKNLKEGECYHIEELNRWFDEWYSDKLHTVVYEQYKDVKTAKVEIIKEEPKGNAAAELKEMIGLDSAKEVITNAVNFFKMQKLYEEKGLNVNRPSMHMVFTGNPGTAKTTVARLFAQIMKDNGLLTKGDLYEVGRADIVGQYVGSTAPLVKKHFKMAKGSVLFIDEAYSLVDDKDGLYGDEAINTIVQEMENNRDDLVVIFAGYPDKMEEFLNKNPGLRSRIAFHVSFDDYNTGELVEIADLMIKKTGLKFDEEAYQKLDEVFDAAREKLDFGNGRYVRNLIELSTLKQASRLAKSDLDHITDEEMETITAADISAPLLSHDDGKTARIGF
jgi:AAA+ superfamily predicted ATPase